MRIHSIKLLGISAVVIAHLSTARGATPELRVGFDSWVGFAGVFAAVDQGFFEKQGVKVELRAFPGPTDTIAPTIAGDLDIALTTPTTSCPWMPVKRQSSLRSTSSTHRWGPMPSWRGTTSWISRDSKARRSR